eukprot:3621555-Pleurochrysis_carterae.AAC.2
MPLRWSTARQICMPRARAALLRPCAMSMCGDSAQGLEYSNPLTFTRPCWHTLAYLCLFCGQQRPHSRITI